MEINFNLAFHIVFKIGIDDNYSLESYHSVSSGND